jgi:hypothetical protein
MHPILLIKGNLIQRTLYKEYYYAKVYINKFV